MSIAQTILEKIGFINNGQPAINDINLNQLQTNVQNALDDARTKTDTAIGEIIESGSNANGSYIKWSDGTMICFKRVNFGNMSIRNPWGAFYESEQLDIGNYAQPFKEEPRTFIMPVNTFFIERLSDMNATSFGSFYATRPVETDIYITVDCLAIGKWK